MIDPWPRVCGAVLSRQIYHTLHSARTSHLCSQGLELAGEGVKVPDATKKWHEAETALEVSTKIEYNPLTLVSYVSYLDMCQCQEG